MINNNALSILTDSCNIQCPLCYPQHRSGPKAMRSWLLVVDYLCPALLMELWSSLHCFETSFDRCSPQLFTEELLLSLEIFLTQLLPASKKQGSFMEKASHLCSATPWDWSVKFPSISCLTSLQGVEKTNLLARVTSLSFKGERKILPTANCRVL